MKSRNIVILSMIIIFWGTLHPAATEFPNLLIENNSPWKIEIADTGDLRGSNLMLEPEDHVTLARIPRLILFYIHGRMVVRPLTIDVDNLLRTNKIAQHSDQVPSDSTLIITFSMKGKFQRLGISASLEKKTDVAAEVESKKSAKFAEGLIRYIANETGIVLNYSRDKESLDIIPERKFAQQYFRGTLSGGDHSLSLQNWFDASTSQKTSVLNKLVNEYKIHLMPNDKDLWEVTKTLLNEIKSNIQLQQVIGYIKIKPILEKDEQLQKEREISYGSEFPEDYWNLPRIVIFIGGGKAAAQIALNEIYKKYKGITGLNRGPGFNQKVTSLIYFAQGNRADKKPANSKYFEQPKMIYYDPIITGTREDYHLDIPHE